ncbi:MAG: hypothetical protein U9O90_00170 [Euryarchaeota archaeon]|nr:hypothetical protein [Euryarchaeota archaeon]
MRFKVAKRLEEVEKVLCSKGDAPAIYVVPFGQYSLRRKGCFMLLYNF